MKRIINNGLEYSLLEKKKIFWLSFLVFGYSNVISQTEMVKHLSKLGEEVHLFAMAPNRNYQRNSNKHFILFPMKFIPIITPILYTLALFISIPFYIIIGNPDYIITDKGTTIIGFALKFLLRPTKIKVVLDIRSTPIEIRGTFREYLDALLFRISINLAKKKLDGVTILTELMKKEICYEFDIDPKFVGVWTSGVSTMLFDPENFDGKEMRKKLGLNDKFIIFYHGALGIGRVKEIIAIINCLKILKSQYSDLVLFLLGGGDGVLILRKLTRESDLEDFVIIREKVDYAEVPKYIAMCDVGIVPLPDSPNWRYQCPLKLLEYLAMRKVVIATDIPANREIIAKSKCGIYISSTDPEEIAKAIVYAYNNRERLGEWGKFGRGIVEKSYTWEKVAEDLENYLLSL